MIEVLRRRLMFFNFQITGRDDEEIMSHNSQNLK